MTQTILDALVILGAATVASIITGAHERIRAPVVVAEVALGILIGPQVLHLASVGPGVTLFSNFGLAFLFFFAGYEIDVQRIAGRPLRLAGLTWAVSVVLALAVAGLLQAVHVTGAFQYVGLAMATTAMGTLIPVLRDAGEFDTPFGTYLLAVGAVGEFGPIVLAALFLNEDRRTIVSALILNAFVLVVLAGVLLVRHWRPQVIARLVRETMHSSAQLAVRLSLLALLAFSVLAQVAGFDFYLGAFAAGLIVAQAVHAAGDPPESEHLSTKYAGIGFGLFIPVFFIVTGMNFDLRGLLANPTELALVPLFLALFFVVRGVPSVALYRRALEPRRRGALAFFAATELPLVVAITEQGVQAHKLSAGTSAAMVGAAMLSVLVFPLVFLRLRGQRQSSSAGDRA